MGIMVRGGTGRVAISKVLGRAGNEETMVQAAKPDVPLAAQLSAFAVLPAFVDFSAQLHRVVVSGLSARQLLVGHCHRIDAGLWRFGAAHCGRAAFEGDHLSAGHCGNFFGIGGAGIFISAAQLASQEGFDEPFKTKKPFG